MGGASVGKSSAELLGVVHVPDRGRGRLVATAVELFYRLAALTRNRSPTSI
jgi:hypothetical protein